MVENEQKQAERLDGVVGRLLKGRQPRVGPADAGQRHVILAATQLAGVKKGYPRMSARFRRRLARQLARQQQEPTESSRRAALVGGVSLAVGGVAGALAASRLMPSTHPAAPNYGGRTTLEPAASSAVWVDTGLVAEQLREGIGYRVNAGSVRAFVVNYEGKLLGLSAICTHLPCELHWQAQQGNLSCPCHDQSFSIEGVSLNSAYPLPPLPMVNVRVREGKVEVLGTH
jgi:nitrite reductase/ring-hydroxylating ferredoxin subunit